MSSSHWIMYSGNPLGQRFSLVIPEARLAAKQTNTFVVEHFVA